MNATILKRLVLAGVFTALAATGARADATDARARWEALSPQEKEKVRERFERFNQLSPAEKEQMRGAMEKFRALPPERRQVLQQRFQRFQQMDPSRREVLQRRWERFQKLPPNGARRCANGTRISTSSHPPSGRNCAAG